MVVKLYFTQCFLFGYINKGSKFCSITRLSQCHCTPYVHYQSTTTSQYNTFIHLLHT
nr:MAG TPA: hypothetical protein [Caudoviricetes sp.]